jgi:multidrug efflux pump subunit AcrB
MKDHAKEHPEIKYDPTLDASQQKMHLLAHAEGNGKLSRFERIRNRFVSFLQRMFPYRKPIVLVYVVVVIGITALMLTTIGRDVLPKVNSRQFQVYALSVRKND